GRAGRRRTCTAAPPPSSSGVPGWPAGRSRTSPWRCPRRAGRWSRCSRRTPSRGRPPRGRRVRCPAPPGRRRCGRVPRRPRPGTAGSRIRTFICNIGSMTVRAAAYMRISQDRTGDGWAIDTQRRKIGDLAKLRGWRVVAEYEDSSVSASKPRGAGTDWARMLKDADAGRFDIVVAVDIDRLLRSTKDLNTLIDHGLQVVTVDGEIDLATADGEFR